MSILVVGGDSLGGIPAALKSMGATEVKHWKGRKVREIRKSVPKKTDMIVVLTDYLNHTLSRKVKEEAKELSLPVIYTKRSLSQLTQKIEAILK